MSVFVCLCVYLEEMENVSIYLCVSECVFVCNWGRQVAYVLPIINNIFTVDMSAIFQSSDLIYIFSRPRCFLSAL